MGASKHHIGVEEILVEHGRNCTLPKSGRLSLVGVIYLKSHQMGNLDELPVRTSLRNQSSNKKKSEVHIPLLESNTRIIDGEWISDALSSEKKPRSFFTEDYDGLTILEHHVQKDPASSVYLKRSLKIDMTQRNSANFAGPRYDKGIVWIVDNMLIFSPVQEATGFGLRHSTPGHCAGRWFADYC